MSPEKENVIYPKIKHAKLCQQYPYGNLVQLAFFLKSCGLIREAALLLAIKAIDEAYNAQMP